MNAFWYLMGSAANSNEPWVNPNAVIVPTTATEYFIVFGIAFVVFVGLVWVTHIPEEKNKQMKELGFPESGSSYSHSDALLKD